MLGELIGSSLLDKLPPLTDQQKSRHLSQSAYQSTFGKGEPFAFAFPLSIENKDVSDFGPVWLLKHSGILF